MKNGTIVSVEGKPGLWWTVEAFDGITYSLRRWEPGTRINEFTTASAEAVAKKRYLGMGV